MSKDYVFTATTTLIIILLITLVAASLSYSSARSSNKGAQNLPKFEFTDYSVLKNLTYVDLYSFSTHDLVAQIPVVNISSINVTLNDSSSSPGSKISAGIVYGGTFNFNNYNVSAFLNKTVNIYYLGYYQNGSRTMHVPGNGPNSTRYFKSVGNSQIITPPGASPSQELELQLNITPTVNASGKDWYICGGVFIAFKNNSAWVGEFDNLSLYRTSVSNDTVFNKISDSCAMVYVK